MRLDLVDAREVVRIRRRRLVARALDRIHRVVGRELAVAVVALHAAADLERPFRAGRIRRPALGEIGLDGFGIDRAGLQAHEAVEHPAQQALVGRRRRDVRVELAGVGGAHADDQRLLLRVRDRRCKESSSPSPRSRASSLSTSPRLPALLRRTREYATYPCSSGWPARDATRRRSGQAGRRQDRDAACVRGQGRRTASR